MREGVVTNHDQSFSERLEAAAKAKQALLEKARQKDPVNDPEFAARQAARAEAARIREEREAERRTLRQAEIDRQRADRERQRQERERIRAEQERLAAEEAARKAQLAVLEADRLRRGKRPVSKPPGMK